jgi:hypothetical protein
MRLYISGKITGNENYKENFTVARIKLENAGYDVCDPNTALQETSGTRPPSLPGAGAEVFFGACQLPRDVRADGVNRFCNLHVEVACITSAVRVFGVTGYEPFNQHVSRCVHAVRGDAGFKEFLAIASVKFHAAD